MIDSDLKLEEPAVSDDSVSPDADQFQREFDNPQSQSSTSGKSSKSKANRKLYCFSCHRTENHANGLRGKPHHYLLIGLTFGLAALFGPWRCRCCGHLRMARYNFLNPRYHYHRWKYSGKSSRLTTRKSASKSKSRSRSERAEKNSEPSRSRDNNKSRRRKKLRAVPAVDSIGRERREREKQALEQQTIQAQSGSMGFSIEGLIDSFETRESRAKRERDLKKAQQEPLVPRKPVPSRKVKGKRKRRYAKKQRLTGPKLYCFACKQNNEHFHCLKGKPLYFFFFGISLGISTIVGPFRCSVCSRKRLMRMNLLNPKFYVRSLLARGGDGYH